MGSLGGGVQGSLRPLLSRTGIPPESLIRRCSSTWPGVEALCVCWIWVQGCRVPRGAGQAFLLILGRTHRSESSQPEACLLAHLHPLSQQPPNGIRFYLEVFTQGSPSAWRSFLLLSVRPPTEASIHIPTPVSLPASEPGAPLGLPPSLSEHQWTLAACQHRSSSRVGSGHSGTHTCACGCECSGGGARRLRVVRRASVRGASGHPGEAGAQAETLSSVSPAC